MSFWTRESYTCKRCGYVSKKPTNFCPRCGAGGDDDEGGEGCFIATSCYGWGSDELNFFRSWRDNKLLKSKNGRKFVNFYYKTSPPIARFISDKPLIKKIVRLGLYPIKEFIK